MICDISGELVIACRLCSHAVVENQNMLAVMCTRDKHDDDACWQVTKGMHLPIRIQQRSSAVKIHQLTRVLRRCKTAQLCIDSCYAVGELVRLGKPSVLLFITTWK